MSKARGIIVYDETQMAQLIPQHFSLSQNYPNPFDAAVTNNSKKDLTISDIFHIYTTIFFEHTKI
ncbi:hypothetical protein JXJ21_22390 [candidate division KSB1 bacterium]|nr:hypothetical protein [candidate division KSB1 bacterium]